MRPSTGAPPASSPEPAPWPSPGVRVTIRAVRGFAISLALALAALALPTVADAAVNSAFDTMTGALSVSSTASDPIAVACSGGNVTVNASPIAGPVACFAVTSVTVTGDSGDNKPIDLGSVSFVAFTGISTSGTHVTISGGFGDDNIIGSSFADEINGSGGTNVMGAGEGNDHFTMTQDGATNTLNGGGGNDTITLAGNSNGSIVVHANDFQNLDGAHQIADIEGATVNAPFQENQFDMTESPFPWTINGNGSNDTFWSGPFNDTFNGNGGGVPGDIAGAKTDSASVTLSNTSLSGSAIGTDTLSGVEQAQILSPSVLGTSSAVVDSNWDAGAFTNGKVDLEGGTGSDILVGGAGSDVLGAPAVNMIPGGALEEGDDLLIGNGGSDQVRGGPGTDTAGQSGVAAATVGASSMNANGTDTFTSIDVVSLVGTAGADTMSATAFGGRVIFNGLGGTDTLTGSAQNDTITGGADADALTGGAGVDTLLETATGPTSALLTDSTLSGFGGAPDEAISGFEAAQLNGSAGADVFDASAFTGPVTLVGGDGADTLTGGTAADSLVGDAGADTLNARDGGADALIDCGADDDGAETDTADPTPVGCETVNGAPFAPPGNPGGPSGPSGPGETLDTTAPVMGISVGRVNRRGRLPLRLTCPATEQSCTGRFVLRLAGKRKTKLGSGTFTVAGGKVVLLKVKLTRKGRALLRKRGRLKAVLTLTATDAAGNTLTRAKTIRVRR